MRNDEAFFAAVFWVSFCFPHLLTKTVGVEIESGDVYAASPLDVIMFSRDEALVYSSALLLAMLYKELRIFCLAKCFQKGIIQYGFQQLIKRCRSSDGHEADFAGLVGCLIIFSGCFCHILRCNILQLMLESRGEGLVIDRDRINIRMIAME